MAKERSATEIKCRLHEEEMYRYYCKECKDCVCTQCLEETHDEHTFCKLQGAENVIRQDLKSFVPIDCPEGEVATVTGLVTVLKDKQGAFHVDRSQLIQQIEDAVDNVIQKVKESKERLITVIENEYAERDAFVNKQLEKLDSFKAMIKDIEQTPTDIFGVIDILINMKTALTAINNYMVKTTKPQFMCNELEISIGKFPDLQIDIGVNESANPEKPTQDVKKTAGIVNVEGGSKEENSSDEVTDVSHPVVISDAKLTNVKKIIPLSKNDAWVSIGSDLRKIVSNVLEETIHAQNIKDFALLSNGSILILRPQESIIQEILINGRTAPFTDVRGGNIPCTVCVHNELVFVNIANLQYSDHYRLNGITLRKLCVFTIDGVPISTSEISHFGIGQYPFLTFHVHKTENETFQYSLMNASFESEKKIVRLSNKSSEPLSFVGAFEVTPSASTFQCCGACVDDIGNVIVCDKKYKKVCVLDKNLKFKHVLVTNANVELKAPRGLAVSDGILWVADQEKIFKFKYNSKAAKLIIE